VRSSSRAVPDLVGKGQSRRTVLLVPARVSRISGFHCLQGGVSRQFRMTGAFSQFMVRLIYPENHTTATHTRNEWLAAARIEQRTALLLTSGGNQSMRGGA
jgi:hypothetical protein